MKSICLVMIVKNESKIIRRCLDNVKDKINYWVIVDTGSEDKTKEIILETLKDIPGELHDRKWVNFGVNRSESLSLAKGKADYLLLCDADENILFSADFNADDLTADAYLLSYIGGLDYSVPYLIRGDYNWRYVGVTHEYLDCDVPVKKEKLGTISIFDSKDGGSKADKFERDIRLLEQGLIEEPDNSRYKFYLANSYRDIGNYEKAIEWYLKRINDGEWIEEVTVAYERLGLCYEKLNNPEKALYYWLLGYDYNPKRAECLYYAIRQLRREGKSRLGYQLGLMAEKIAYPINDILFINKDIYEYLLDYEMSINAYYVDDLKKGFDACKSVFIKCNDKDLLDITLGNIRYYKEAFHQDPSYSRYILSQRLADLYPENHPLYDKAQRIMNWLK
ncbi:tetratricopeptide repeat-containing glycosyltransferase [Avibacterium sp. 21-599]|uniref:tetratricopeptide repeat-containing glycosyltransferase n=1 Tax=Avibacterium sp. 21-599 TaxID=2911528 RepID=UPI002246685F|nr:glycosyltransferase [Avibacterium sp. 21-599]MCW9718875.1 glycosyltransferase [Avibacterium sp. 21-599]